MAACAQFERALEAKQRAAEAYRSMRSAGGAGSSGGEEQWGAAGPALQPVSGDRCGAGVTAASGVRAGEKGGWAIEG